MKTPAGGDAATPRPESFLFEKLDDATFDRIDRTIGRDIRARIPESADSPYTYLRAAVAGILLEPRDAKFLRELGAYLEVEYFPSSAYGIERRDAAIALVRQALEVVAAVEAVPSATNVRIATGDAPALERSRPAPKLVTPPEEARGVPFPSPAGSSSGTSGEPESRGAIVAAESLIRRHRDELTTLRGAIAGANAPGMREALEILDAEVAPPDVDELAGIASGVDAALRAMAALGKRLEFLETAWGIPGKPEMVRLGEHRKLEARVEDLAADLEKCARADRVAKYIGEVDRQVVELTKRVDAHRDQFPALREELQNGDKKIRERFDALLREHGKRLDAHRSDLNTLHEATGTKRGSCPLKGGVS